MRILLANKFYYRRGGDCVYMINLQELLEAHGHEVAIFAMQHPENLPSKWESYFPSEVSFSPKKPLQFIKAIFRPFFSFEVWWKFRKLLNDFQPDVVHLNNIHSQLSPLIAKMAHDRGIRVIWTLHDYKLLCPRYDCLRNGKPCELCFSGKKSHAFKFRCLKGSALGSAIAWLESVLWSRSRLELWTDVFICPSQFLRNKMKQGGCATDKLTHLCNFIDSLSLPKPQGDRNYYCYIGRLSQEKGVETLLKAAERLPYRLLILGTGPLADKLESKYRGVGHIEFMGHCSKEIVQKILVGSRFMVLPSEWYENNPLSVVEAMVLGVPVLGANIGGIPELVEFENGGGMLFTSGDASDLELRIGHMWETTWTEQGQSRNDYSSENYIQRIKKLYARD